MTSRKRFYQEVFVAAQPNGFSVLLDGKPILTPARAELTLPTKALAEAIAEEWRAQVDTIRPETMVLTKLANTGIDRAGPNRAGFVEQILAFARSDLVCYRAEAPAELISRQTEIWDPLLDWVRQRYGASLRSAMGIGFVEQPPEALDALAGGIAEYDVFALAALQAAAALLGSAVVALTLAGNRLQPEEAFAAAQLDEIYQAEKWGADHEAEMRSRAKFEELFQIARFLRLLQQ
jgi:chaperone required for assembly of F1-ATPase